MGTWDRFQKLEREGNWRLGYNSNSSGRELTQDFALNRQENEAVIFFLYGKDIYFALIIDLAELGIESGAVCILGSAPLH